jgi:homocysteine S-methyltransferase
MNLLEEIEHRPVCGDGAMSTLLAERGIPADKCSEELCLTQPELVVGVHADYLAAGARIIRTNSFGANAVRLSRHGLADHVNEINWQAAQIALLATRSSQACVAGRVGPLGLSAREAQAQGIDRKEVFHTQIGALLDGGVHLIVLEAFSDLDELLLALHVKHSLHHCPAICSLAVDENGLLPDGMPLETALAKLKQNDAEILGLNFTATAPHLIPERTAKETSLAVFLDLTGKSAPSDFAQSGLTMIERGARIVVGGSSTAPAHIAALAETLNPKTK